MVDYLAGAWSAVPGYADAVAAENRAKAITVATPARGLSDVHADMRAALLTGEPVDELLAEIPDVVAAQEAALLTGGQVAQLRQALKANVEVAKESGVNDALRWLAGQLEELLRGLKPHAKRLRTVSTATEALHADDDTVASWRALELAASAYTALRDAQFRVMRVEFGADGQAGQLETDIRDAGHVKAGPRRHQMRHDGLSSWPDRTRTEPDFPTDPIEQLLAAVRGDVELWLPSTDEFRAARVKINRRPRTTLDYRGPITEVEFKRNVAGERARKDLRDWQDERSTRVH